MSEENEAVEVEAKKIHPEGSRAAVKKYGAIGAGLVAAVLAVLVALGVIDDDTAETVTVDADCLRRCLAGEVVAGDEALEEGTESDGLAPEALDGNSPWPD